MLNLKIFVDIGTFICYHSLCADEKAHPLERYRSGHNEAVLKTVCPKGRMGSNPILSALFHLNK